MRCPWVVSHHHDRRASFVEFLEGRNGLIGCLWVEFAGGLDQKQRRVIGKHPSRLSSNPRRGPRFGCSTPTEVVTLRISSLAARRGTGRIGGG